MIGASVPQILADRAARRARPLGDWLLANGLDWDHATVAFLTEIEHSPRDIYYAYLQILGALGTLADVPVDLTAFPTAPDLGVPRTGRLGFQVDATETGLTARLSYETTAAEVLLNTSLLSWYTVGIVAAVAVPAYEDYMNRAAGAGAMGGECPFTEDGECDEPMICAPGTDVADCSAAGPDSCPFASDGECDEPNPCSPGTDTTDCAGLDLGPDSCIYANDGECDEPQYCAEGTDTTDCGGI
jgi:hypothetical protein